jgi:hypothetical protein
VPFFDTTWICAPEPPFSAEYVLETTRISLTDSAFGVTTAAPPQAWLIAVTPSS